jgi:hypothetical protein
MGKTEHGEREWKGSVGKYGKSVFKGRIVEIGKDMKRFITITLTFQSKSIGKIRSPRVPVFWIWSRIRIHGSIGSIIFWASRIQIHKY